MKAPPNALRRITVTRGTVASANACTSVAPWRITPAASWRVPGMKPGRVDEHQQRDPERVALADEARALLGAGRVEHAAEIARLVGDHADRPPVDPGHRGDEVARPAGRDLEQLAAVDERARSRRARRRPGAPRAAPSPTGRAAGAAGQRAAAAARRGGWAGSRAARAPAGRSRGRRAATKWQTPLRWCTRVPPSCSASTSSPSASRTTPGPVRNMLDSSVITTQSVSAGE